MRAIYFGGEKNLETEAQAFANKCANEIFAYYDVGGKFAVFFWKGVKELAERNFKRARDEMKKRNVIEEE